MRSISAPFRLEGPLLAAPLPVSSVGAPPTAIRRDREAIEVGRGIAE